MISYYYDSIIQLFAKIAMHVAFNTIINNNSPVFTVAWRHKFLLVKIDEIFSRRAHTTSLFSFCWIERHLLDLLFGLIINIAILLSFDHLNVCQDRKSCVTLKIYYLHINNITINNYSPTLLLHKILFFLKSKSISWKNVPIFIWFNRTHIIYWTY